MSGVLSIVWTNDGTLFVFRFFIGTCFSKIRFFWEPGAFDDKGGFVNDRLKCINKVRVL